MPVPVIKGLFSKLLGTLNAFFQFGGVLGPGINANGAALETKNAANTAFAVHRGAPPVGPNDFVTKAFAIASTTPVVVFRPGGVAGGNVYTTEATLATATQAFGGAPYVLFFDLSLTGTPGFYTFLTVGALNLAPRGIWTDGGVTQGNGSAAQYSNQLTFTNGTVMPNPPSDVCGFIQIECNQPYPNLPWQSTVSSGKTTFRDGSGAWVNAGMAPLISSVNDWEVILSDMASLNFGPIATGPLTAAQLNFALQVNLSANDGTYVGPLTINFGFNVTSPSVFVDPSCFPFMSIGQMWVDVTGTGNLTIPASDAGTDETSGGLLWVQGGTNPGTLYWSNGTNWIRVDAASFSYTPTSLPHWSGVAPSSIGNALDRIAAKISPIP